MNKENLNRAKRELILEMMHYNSQIRNISSTINSAVSQIEMLKAGVDNAFDRLLRELDKEQTNEPRD